MKRFPSYIQPLLLVLALTVGNALAEEPYTPKVLIVYSYNQELAWTQQCDAGILERLPRNALVDRMYLDSKRIPLSRLARKVREVLLYAKSFQPDAVMLGDDNALMLLGEKLAATGVPIVYFGLNGNPRDFFKTMPPNVTGVVERIPLFHWIRIILDIVPDSRTMLVLLDQSKTTSSIVASSFGKRRAVAVDNTMVRYAVASSWTHWQEIILKSDHDVLLLPTYHALHDADDQHHDYAEAITWASAHSKVPTFAVQDYAVRDNGVVGSFSVQGTEHGRLAGALVTKILNGVSIPHLSKNDEQQGRLYFNKKQLERFGLTLPEPIKSQAHYK